MTSDRSPSGPPPTRASPAGAAQAGAAQGTSTESLAARVDRLRAEVAGHRHGRVPAALRRQLIVAVATELFVERGYDGVSMADVAEAAGVSKPVVYDLVGSKDRLFDEVMVEAADDLAGRVAAAVASTDGTRSSLRAGATAFFEFVDERRAAWESLLTSDATPVRAAVERTRRRQVTLVSELLAGEVPQGSTVNDVVLEALATALNGAFEALAQWWQSHPEWSLDAVVDLVVAMTEPGLEAMAGVAPAQVTSSGRRDDRG
ncbi:MAG: TetR/AcrR family transcriptional regulator [Acidimicrobiia bacterium]|nr:TetR/AcrR family transcriptional regulator [Acidimicrobiia bacterium]